MIVVFIGGHGRCDDNLPCPVPENMSVIWYGDKGNPVSKSFSSAVLSGALTDVRDTSTHKDPPCEHYSCDSLAEEYRMRAEAFLKGPWNENTYFIQAKQDMFVPLSSLFGFAKKKWTGPIEFRWAVCRSSVVKRGQYMHSIKEGTKNTPEDVPREDGSPSKKPGVAVATEGVEGAIYLQQFGTKLLSYGGISELQERNLKERKVGGDEFDLQPKKPKRFSGSFANALQEAEPKTVDPEPTLETGTKKPSWMTWKPAPRKNQQEDGEIKKEKYKDDVFSGTKKEKRLSGGGSFFS